MKQKDLFYLKEKKKTCGKWWENERSQQVLGAFQLVSERERETPPRDRSHPHPPSATGPPEAHMSEEEFVLPRGDCEGCQCSGREKTRKLYGTCQRVEA